MFNSVLTDLFFLLLQEIGRAFLTLFDPFFSSVCKVALCTPVLDFPELGRKMPDKSCLATVKRIMETLSDRPFVFRIELMLEGNKGEGEGFNFFLSLVPPIQNR